MDQSQLQESPGADGCWGGAGPRLVILSLLTHVMILSSQLSDQVSLLGDLVLHEETKLRNCPCQELPGTCCCFVEEKKIPNKLHTNQLGCGKKRENNKSLPWINSADNAKMWRGSVWKSLTGGGEITKEGPTTPPGELHPRKYRRKKIKLYWWYYRNNMDTGSRTNTQIQ